MKVPGLVARAHQICGELNGGTSVDDRGKRRDEPWVRIRKIRIYHHQGELPPESRVRRTAVRFIAAISGLSTAQAINRSTSASTVVVGRVEQDR
jgi:hypothetical protein